MAHRNRYRTGRSDDDYRSDYGRRNRGYGNESYGGSGFGDEYDREENYFGGGGDLNYGSGYSGTTYERGFSSYDREMDNDYSSSGRGNRGYGQRNYSRRSRPMTYDRDPYFNRNFPRRDEHNGNDRSYSRGYERPDYGYDNDYDYDDRGWFDKAADEVSSWFGDEQAERRRRMDARRQGNRGRGPSGYKRSDDRIKEDINDRLTDDYYLDASQISVEVNNGEVSLSGNVNSRFAKRHAEDLVEDVSGVSHCENRIRVSDNFYSTTDDSSATSGISESSKSRSKTA